MLDVRFELVYDVYCDMATAQIGERSSRQTPAVHNNNWSQALKASDWHIEGAFDFFYSQPQLKTFTDSRHLEELYNRYKAAVDNDELQGANPHLKDGWVMGPILAERYKLHGLPYLCGLNCHT
ncbi:hypothetical protein V8G54_027289 [Vigna mungo]|uniref:Uncharacterized protein n=1 Tax=Vigna mungo TaxID=3915 RepID=A0AAQ3N2E5_VIGMU